MFKYMYDSEHPFQVCLRNVFDNQVGKLPKHKKLPSFHDRNVNASPYAIEDIKVALGDRFQEYEQLFQETHRSTPTVDTLFAGMNKYINNTKNEMFASDTQTNPHYIIAKREIEKRFFGAESALMPLPLSEIRDNLIQYLSEPSASAGYPFIQIQGCTKKRDAVVTPQFKKDVDDMVAFLVSDQNNDPFSYRKLSYPCVAYQKTSAVKPGKEEKVRFIWGYPLLMVAFEAMFAVPLIECAKKREDDSELAPTSFRMTAYSGGYAQLVEKYGQLGASVTDYSSYDTTVPSWLIQDVFAMIKKHFVMGSVDERIFEMVENYFIHTPMLFKETGTLFCKHHGIPSGSWFTNIVGSLCNAIIMMTCNSLVRMKPMIMKVMGDDNLVIGGCSDFLELKHLLIQYFGVVINPKKCYSGYLINAKFLGRRFSEKVGAFKGWKKSIADSFLSLIYPSKVDDAISYHQRLYSIYLDNPVRLLWKMVLRKEEEILEALKMEFDTNENREVVYTMFNGDYEKARSFFASRSSKILSPLELAHKF